MKSSKPKFQTKLKTNSSFAQHTHRIFQAFERQRKHAVADQLLDDADADADAKAVLPYELLRGGDSGKFGLDVSCCHRG